MNERHFVIITYVYIMLCLTMFELIGPWGSGNNFKVILNVIIQNNRLSTRCGIDLKWMPQHFTHEKAELLLVMAWCHQATSHCLSQCRPWSMLSNGVSSHNEFKSVTRVYLLSTRTRITQQWRNYVETTFGCNNYVVCLIASFSVTSSPNGHMTQW